jgi:hypothetical protein
MCDILELLMPKHTLAEIEYAYQELQWAWRLILSNEVQDWELLARIHAELGRLERPLRLHRRLR